jgi:hypothetical protein
MFVFGHIGYSWGAAVLATRMKRSARLPLLALAVAALGPDLVDKVAATTLLHDAPTSRLWAHSLVVQAIVLGVVWTTRRGWFPYALMLPLHVVFDAIDGWTPGSFFWPLLGWSFPPTDSYGHLDCPLTFLRFIVERLAESPLALAWEAGGLVVITLVLMGRRRPDAHGA